MPNLSNIVAGPGAAIAASESTLLQALLATALANNTLQETTINTQISSSKDQASVIEDNANQEAKECETQFTFGISSALVNGAITVGGMVASAKVGSTTDLDTKLDNLNNLETRLQGNTSSEKITSQKQLTAKEENTDKKEALLSGNLGDEFNKKLSSDDLDILTKQLQDNESKAAALSKIKDLKEQIGTQQRTLIEKGASFRQGAQTAGQIASSAITAGQEEVLKGIKIEEGTLSAMQTMLQTLTSLLKDAYDTESGNFQTMTQLYSTTLSSMVAGVYSANYSHVA